MAETITIENPKSLAFRILLRFLRAFVLGGIATMAVVAPLASLSMGDFKVWGIALINAFVVGGLLALDKAIRK